ncbi:WD40 repeat-like protein [Leucogyrophana mollusca]|uniref:WD40 repeat-like protein n=1 Tax=Leucogyrophana mollusca TaxID=85980 RepID=A0ACB8BI84_9AGAM|nr:WD40 repeat-like protein [Leucogyrophana mollusca]
MSASKSSLPPSLRTAPPPKPCCTRTLKGHSDMIWCMAYTPDGRYIISGSVDKSIRVWDVTTGDAIGPPLEGHSGDVLTLAITPDGKNVISASRDGTVRVWDLSSRRATNILKLPPPTAPPSISPDGRQILSPGGKTIVIWHIDTDTSAFEPLQGHTDRVTAVAWSQDGKKFASISVDKNLWVWDAGTRQLTAGPFRCENHNWSIVFSSDGRHIICGDLAGRIWIFDYQSGCLASFGPLVGHTRVVYSLVSLANGRRVASGSQDGSVCIWDTATGTLVVGPFQGHSADIILCVACSPDGRFVASGSDDGTIRVWDTEAAITDCQAGCTSVSAIQNQPPSARRPESLDSLTLNASISSSVEFCH